MKKIIILVMSIILMLSLFVVFPSAVDTLEYSNVYDKSYYYTLVGYSEGTVGVGSPLYLKDDLLSYNSFSFPIVNGLDTANAYKFSNFYVVEQTMMGSEGFRFGFYLKNGGMTFGNVPMDQFALTIHGSSLVDDTITVHIGSVTCNDGYFYIDPTTMQFGICLLNNDRIVKTQLIEHGSLAEARLLENIVPMSDIPTNDSTFYVPKFSIGDEEPIEENILDIIFSPMSNFINGIGTGFVNAFTSTFLDNGSINPLGVMILVFFGISLGYGLIRWITGLFRRESK